MATSEQVPAAGNLPVTLQDGNTRGSWMGTPGYSGHFSMNLKLLQNKQLKVIYECNNKMLQVMEGGNKGQRGQGWSDR